jgi:hypothetical protein
MNKRTFIKLFAAALASTPVMRLLAWAGQEKLRNWAGNIEYRTNLTAHGVPPLDMANDNVLYRIEIQRPRNQCKARRNRFRHGDAQMRSAR